METEQILKHPPRVLCARDREQYFNEGYVSLEGYIDSDRLDALNEVTQQFIEASRQVTESGDVFDIAPGHSSERPMLRRLKLPDIRHQQYWAVVMDKLLDVAADVLGPNVMFHHSKLNFKWPGGGDDVKWHQDAPFFPHTNDCVITIGLYLNDTGEDDAPLGVIPGSHQGPIYDHYASDGKWSGHLSDDDVATLATDTAHFMPGKAGTITIHNYRTVHGSASTRSAAPRPLLLNCLSAADARPYTANPQGTHHTGEILCGEMPRWSHHDPRPCLLPPDWSGGYTSIYAAQAGEDG